MCWDVKETGMILGVLLGDWMELMLLPQLEDTRRGAADSGGGVLFWSSGVQERKGISHQHGRWWEAMGVGKVPWS